jgi:hypothetical protein
MEIFRSSHEASPHAKLFKELISQLGQPSQLAAPKYEDSTKRHAPRRHILAVERREKNFVTLTLTMRESCSVGSYVCVNRCLHVSALPKLMPHRQLPAYTTTKKVEEVQRTLLENWFQVC